MAEQSIQQYVSRPLSIRATLRIRNDKMTSARKRLGLSQKAVADLADVDVNVIQKLERFCYAIGKNRRQYADRIALTLELDTEDVMPRELEGTTLQSKFDRTFEAMPDSLPQEVSETLINADAVYLKERMEKVLNTLTYREKEILKLRYGIGDPDGYTYTREEVGRIFKVPRDRVRQVEAKALNKLRNPVRADKLRGFVDVEDLGVSL